MVTFMLIFAGLSILAIWLIFAILVYRTISAKRATVRNMLMAEYQAREAKRAYLYQSALQYRDGN
jgi:hypothetical protein